MTSSPYDPAQAIWQSMMSGRVVALDLETTGLSPDWGHRVISVGVVCVDNGAITHEWHTLVNPECDPGPIHIHGLTTDVLQVAPTFATIAPTLLGILEGSKAVAAHNARFDWGFLLSEFGDLYMDLPEVALLDTQRLARLLKVPCEDEKLATVAAAMGVEQVPDHTALADARTVAHVVQRELWNGVRLHGWTDLHQVAHLAPVAVRGKNDGHDPTGLTLTISLDDVLEEIVESRARQAAWTPEQRAVANKWAFLRDWEDRSLDPARWEEFQADLAVFPADDPDRRNLVDAWRGRLVDQWSDATERAQRLTLLPWLVPAIEQSWVDDKQAGHCRADYASGTHEFTQTLAYMPREEAMTHLKWATELLGSWSDCGVCDVCESNEGLPEMPPLGVYGLQKELLGENWAHELEPSQVLSRYERVFPWLEALRDAGLIDALGEIGRDSFFMLDFGKQWLPAADLGSMLLDAGVEDFEVAERLALIYESKLKDREAAQQVCATALVWQPNQYKMRARGAIEKRYEKLLARKQM